MKNIITIILIGFGLSILTAQVGVERTNVRGDGLMDFPANASKGILLPRLNNTSNTGSTAQGGALAFNLTTDRIEFYSTKPGVEAWVPMTKESDNDYQSTVHSGTKSFSEANGMGTIIEAGTVEADNREGVLKLNSKSKALILPQVPNATQLPNPKPGTICYDMASNSIAVFNGSVWSFWN